MFSVGSTGIFHAPAGDLQDLKNRGLTSHIDVRFRAN